ncbi:S-layer protein [Candidatus Micrarchaeota archaeon]|nr:S-layer protein [Candidatus Micrarchaeota archaeon]
MKSLNVKKIATAAAGAAMLGAAFAGAVQVDQAGLESFNFFSNGAPNLQIVVGSQAQASDAVAAANIAAMIGNLAYTSKDITVLGTDALSCSGGTGTSTASSDEVSLEVTTPGVNPSVAYQMKSFIEGFLDSNSTDDKVDSSVGSAATILSVDANGVSSSFGRKVTPSETSLAFKGTITDPQRTTVTYTEEERYYLYSKTQYDTATKKVKSRNPQIAYEAIFTNPIQVCTEVTPDDSTCSDTYKTPLHRMKVRLLGSEWVIFGMNNFNSNISLPTGGSAAALELGKEIQFKEFMQIGDEVSNPAGIKAVLKDISAVPTGTAQLLSASFEIFDANGNLLDTTTLQESGEYNNHGIVIRVTKVFAGLGQTSYAQVSIFSDRLTVQNGATVSADNQQWRVALVGGGASYGHSLSKVQLIRQVVDDLEAGGSVTFIQSPKLMKLSYNGLEDVTYDTLTFQTGSQSFQTSSTDTTTVNLNYVRVTSGLTSPFDFGTVAKSQFYYIVDSAPVGTSAQGVIFYQDTTSSSAGFFVPYFGTASTSAAATGNITYAGTVTTLNLASLTRSQMRIWNGTSASGDYNAQTGGALCAAFGAVTNQTLDLNTSIGLSALNLNGNATGLTFGQGGGSGTGTPLTTGYTLNQENQNITVSAASINSGCTAGNVTIQFLNTNGSISPGVGTTGVTYGVRNNYVKFNYGAQSVNMRFDARGVSLAAINNGDPTGNATIWIPEYAKDDDTTPGAFSLDVSNADVKGTPRLAPNSGTATVGYSGGAGGGNVYTINSAAANSTFETGFVSPRGSKLEGISTSTATIKYATRLANALYTLSTSGTDTTANTATADYKVGAEALNSNGYKVVVKGISAAGTSTGGSVSGADGLKPSQESAFVVTPLNTASSPLVVRDSQAGAQPLIVVGGPLVNSVALSAMSGGPAPSASDEAVVKVQGDKILVYGFTASDTQEAARSLIGWLAANADSVTGR